MREYFKTFLRFIKTQFHPTYSGASILLSTAPHSTLTPSSTGDATTGDLAGTAGGNIAALVQTPIAPDELCLPLPAANSPSAWFPLSPLLRMEVVEESLLKNPLLDEEVVEVEAVMAEPLLAMEDLLCCCREQCWGEARFL